MVGTHTTERPRILSRAILASPPVSSSSFSSAFTKPSETAPQSFSPAIMIGSEVMFTQRKT